MTRRGRESHGFTLVELAVAVAVIAVAVAILLIRLAYHQEMAEKAAMESAVGLREVEDPRRWLEARPENYGGFYGAGIDRGNWYFDSARRHLVYIVNTGDRLELDTGAPAGEIRFQARLIKDRVTFAGGATESVTAITLMPLTP